MCAVSNTSRISKPPRSSENVRFSDSKLFVQRQKIRQEDRYLCFLGFSHRIRCKQKKSKTSRILQIILIQNLWRWCYGTKFIGQKYCIKNNNNTFLWKFYWNHNCKIIFTVCIKGCNWRQYCLDIDCTAACTIRQKWIIAWLNLIEYKVLLIFSQLLLVPWT